MKEHTALNKRAIYLSIGLSLFLVAIKAYAWLMTDSVSLLSSLLDSSLDVVVSTLNVMAVAYAAVPADEDHRFGHDSIEDIVGLVQAAFIGASALFLIYEASHRFTEPQPIQHAASGIIVLVISMLCALIIVLYERSVARRTGSLVVSADLLHYFSDFLVNASIILSLFLAAKPGWGMADPVIAVGIALYILQSAAKIGIRAFNNLMDRELPPEVLEEITRTLDGETAILGYHALKTRQSGSRRFIQLHLDMDESLSLKQAHEIGARIRDAIIARIGEAEIIIHEDPRNIA